MKNCAITVCRQQHLQAKEEVHQMMMPGDWRRWLVDHLRCQP